MIRDLGTRGEWINDNAINHIPEIPKPMISAIAPARIMVVLIMLWRERKTGNYFFIPLDVLLRNLGSYLSFVRGVT